VDLWIIFIGDYEVVPSGGKSVFRRRYGRLARDWLCPPPFWVKPTPGNWYAGRGQAGDFVAVVGLWGWPLPDWKS